jgi:hypothetical protein
LSTRRGVERLTTDEPGDSVIVKKAVRREE